MSKPTQKSVQKRWDIVLTGIQALWWRRHPDRLNQYPDVTILIEWATDEIAAAWQTLADNGMGDVPPELVKEQKNEPTADAEYPRTLLDLAGYDEREDRMENPKSG